MSFFSELRRRNVFRVAGVYALAGWVLAQIANTLEESLGLPAWFDGLIVALLLIGLPIALIFAWAFELTPEGVVKTENVPENESITPHTARKLDFAIAVSLVLLVIVLIWGQMSDWEPTAHEPLATVATEETGEPDAADASIAVLPFADLSPEGNQEYFSDGLSEEILNVLVAVDGLDVASRTSSFQFKGRDLGIPEIASQLKVRHVVEGSVRKSGNTIRVTAQLIDSQNDKHLWSETYDRPLTAESIFAIQDDIAQSIVDALSNALGLDGLEEVVVTAKTKNLSAYDLYLRAKPLLQSRDSLDLVGSYLAEAVEQDPEFVEAWEMRAVQTALLEEYGPTDDSWEILETKATEYANTAIELNPQSASALAVLAKLKSDANEYDRRSHPIDNTIASFTRVLEISPGNSEALNWRGLQYLFVADFDSAAADFTACRRHAPHYAPCANNLVWTLSAKGDDEGAIESYLESLDSGYNNSQWIEFGLLARNGNELLFKALTNSKDLLSGWSDHDALYVAYRQPDRTYPELVEAILEFTEGKPQIDRVALDMFLFPLGRYDARANAALLWGPRLKSYRQTDSFKDFVNKIGISDHWRKHGFPDQCRPVGQDDFECD